MATLAPGMSFAGCTIEQSIGVGGTATVYRAKSHTGTVALKVFAEPQSESAEKELRRRLERQMTIRDHNHPYLIRILDSGQDEVTKYFYLTTEYIPAPDLRQDFKKIPPEYILPLLSQVASAARFLEERGLVHRDIKPANILIHLGYRKATLLDLGVIRPNLSPETLRSITASNAFVATLRYSPPEVLLQQDKATPEGFRALTFYQLGAVLHDMITGTELFHDFSEKNWLGLLEAAKKSAFSLTAADLRPGIDPSLLVLAKRCLDSDWEKRERELSWEDFVLRRLVRKPTIVFLYAGGTIGSSSKAIGPGSREVRHIEGPSDQLLNRYQRRIHRDYRQLTGCSDALPFEIQWVTLPPEEQILSENADPGTWNALSKAIQEICADWSASPADQQDPATELSPDSPLTALLGPRSALPPNGVSQSQRDRYLVGIIALHGTDTLAYSASALSFALRDLPCPVVLTGSNQPPNERALEEKSIISSTSDVWRNIQRAIEFLLAFGHSLTEVFVSFGDTVHNAINLRKTPVHRIPCYSQSDLRILEEPYTYRNVGMQRQYMFRNIDGIFCNNFYPLLNGIDFSTLVDDRDNTLRHVRVPPFEESPEVSRLVYSHQVAIVLVSPGFSHLFSFFSEISGPFALPQALRAVLIEGYDSGTFPTREGHQFTAFLELLFRMAIPVVLVTRHGLMPAKERYATAPVGGREVKVIRLLGMIVETAAAFVSSVVQGFTPSEWTPERLSGHSDLYDYRVKLIEDVIQVRQAESPNILNAELGNVLEEKVQEDFLRNDITRDEVDYKTRVSSLFSDAGQRAAMAGRIRAGRLQSNLPTTIFLRQHFLWTLLEIGRAFEIARSGPDGLQLLNEIGYFWAEKLMEVIVADESHGDHTLFSRLSYADKKEREAKCSAVISRLVATLVHFGVANLRKMDFDVSHEAGDADYGHLLVLDIAVTKHGRLVRHDELFGVCGFREGTSEFWRRLEEGCGLESTEPEHIEKSGRLYRELLESTWDAKMSQLDWFLVGVFKAAVCRVLRFLNFDPWVQKCKDERERYARALRQSVRTSVIHGDQRLLKLRYSYKQRRVFEL